MISSARYPFIRSRADVPGRDARRRVEHEDGVVDAPLSTSSRNRSSLARSSSRAPRWAVTSSAWAKRYSGRPSPSAHDGDRRAQPRPTAPPTSRECSTSATSSEPAGHAGPSPPAGRRRRPIRSDRSSAGRRARSRPRRRVAPGRGSPGPPSRPGSSSPCRWRPDRRPSGTAQDAGPARPLVVGPRRTAPTPPPTTRSAPSTRSNRPGSSRSGVLFSTKSAAPAPGRPSPAPCLRTPRT